MGEKRKEDRNLERVCKRDSREAQNTEIQLTKELIFIKNNMLCLFTNLPFIE